MVSITFLLQTFAFICKIQPCFSFEIDKLAYFEHCSYLNNQYFFNELLKKANYILRERDVQIKKAGGHPSSLSCYFLAISDAASPVTNFQTFWTP